MVALVLRIFYIGIGTAVITVAAGRGKLVLELISDSVEGPYPIVFMTIVCTCPRCPLPMFDFWFVIRAMIFDPRFYVSSLYFAPILYVIYTGLGVGERTVHLRKVLT